MKNFMGRTMAKMNDNRKKGRKALKGFTLVEIIVVLVILAILAAAMIPALTGYIDKAKERTLITEARNAVTAAQTIASEAYGLGKTVQTASTQAAGTEEGNYTTGYGWSNIIALAEAPGTIEDIYIKNGKVEGLVYKASGTDAKYIKYTRAGGFDDISTAKPTLNKE